MKIYSKAFFKLVTALAVFVNVSTAVAADCASELADDGRMIQASNTFMTTMLKSILAQKPAENFTVSSSSLTAAFSIVLAGASAADQQVVLKSLGFGDLTLKQVLADAKSFEAQLVNNDGYKVVSQNSLFANTPLDPNYVAILKTNLNAHTQQIDFAKRDASVPINAWAKEKTDGLISEIVKDDEIDELAFLALNATLLDAKWAGGQFDSPGYETPFLNDAGEEIGKVPLMTSNPRIQIAQQAYDTFTVYEVPYTLDAAGHPQGSMLVFLPKMLNEREVQDSMWSDTQVKPKLVPLNDVVNSLDADKIAQINSALAEKRQANKVYPLLFNMPKFRAETTVGDELKKMVTDLGAGSIFARINLSAMPAAGEAKEIWSRSKIALIKQKVVIEVAEAGTKAAAVSAIGGFPESCPPPSVNLNRPFAYMIKDGSSGRILFAGTYVAP